MKNYKLRNYIKKGLSYSPLQTIKGHPKYMGYEMKVDELTYEEVKGVMRELSKQPTWETIKNVFETCFKMNEDEFFEGRVKEFFEARNFILETFQKLVRTEKQLLSSLESLDSVLWEQAGGAKLNRHGATLPLNQLGKIYGMYPFDLKDKKYQEILLLLTIEKEQREVQSKYDEMKSKIKNR